MKAFSCGRRVAVMVFGQKLIVFPVFSAYTFIYIYSIVVPFLASPRRLLPGRYAVLLSPDRQAGKATRKQKSLQRRIRYWKSKESVRGLNLLFPLTPTQKKEERERGGESMKDEWSAFSV